MPASLHLSTQAPSSLLFSSLLLAILSLSACQGSQNPNIALVSASDLDAPTSTPFTLPSNEHLDTSTVENRALVDSEGLGPLKSLQLGLNAAVLNGSIQPLALMTHPCPNTEISSTWGTSRSRGRMHRAVDFRKKHGNLGIGLPVLSMVRARVVRIGRPSTNSGRFGRPDRRKGRVRRKGRSFPRRIEVEGYGTVYPFTRTVGSSEMGAMVATEALETELKGHRIRYVHLAAVHPKLKVGDIVEVGQEIGLLGGTGIQKSWPHLHFDISNPQGERVDPRPFIDGLDAKGSPEGEYCLKTSPQNQPPHSSRPQFAHL